MLLNGDVSIKPQNISHNFPMFSATVSFPPFPSCSQSDLNVCLVLVQEGDSQVLLLFMTNSILYELVFKESSEEKNDTKPEESFSEVYYCFD